MIISRIDDLDQISIERKGEQIILQLYPAETTTDDIPDRWVRKDTLRLIIPLKEFAKLREML